MMSKDLNLQEDKLDIFSFVDLILKNIKTLIVFLSVFIILGIIFYYNLPPNIFSKNRHSARVNVLIDDNPIYTKKETADLLNISLAASYNYEKWCNSINKNCDNPWLDQEFASQIQIFPKEHWIMLKPISREHLEEITSYVSFTLDITNIKILKRINNLYQGRINKIIQELEKEKLLLKRIELEKSNRENEILKANASQLKYNNELKTISNNIAIAEEEIASIESLMDSASIDEDRKLTLNLRILDIKNEIKRDKLKIDILKETGKKLPITEMIEQPSSFENFNNQTRIIIDESDEPIYSSFDKQVFLEEQNIELYLEMYPNVEIQMIETTQDINNLNKNLEKLLEEQKYENKQVLTLGMVRSYFRKTSILSGMIPVLTAFIFVALVLCFIFLLLKEEYNKRKKNI